MLCHKIEDWIEEEIRCLYTNAQKSQSFYRLEATLGCKIRNMKHLYLKKKL